METNWTLIILIPKIAKKNIQPWSYANIIAKYFSREFSYKVTQDMVKYLGFSLLYTYVNKQTYAYLIEEIDV